MKFLSGVLAGALLGYLFLAAGDQVAGAALDAVVARVKALAPDVRDDGQEAAIDVNAGADGDGAGQGGPSVASGNDGDAADDARTRPSAGPAVDADMPASPVSRERTGESVAVSIDGQAGGDAAGNANDLPEALRSLEEIRDLPRFQPAWTPFRSETSANGFAHHLSLQLGAEFKVVKRGPGKYEVGFDYVDEAERSRLLNAISSL